MFDDVSRNFRGATRKVCFLEDASRNSSKTHPLSMGLLRAVLGCIVDDLSKIVRWLFRRLFEELLIAKISSLWLGRCFVRVQRKKKRRVGDAGTVDLIFRGFKGCIHACMDTTRGYCTFHRTVVIKAARNPTCPRLPMSSQFGSVWRAKFYVRCWRSLCICGLGNCAV